MSRQRRDEGLSAEELKKKMYQSLQSAGVLNNLKGYLRQSVINELRGKNKKSQILNESDLLAATIKKRDDASWNQKALDNLILYHLKQSRYQYSLSLFQQEAGVVEYDESLTKELFHRLGASPDLVRDLGDDKENDESMSFSTPHTTSTPLAQGSKPEPFLWRIMSKISSFQNLAVKIDQEELMRETKELPRAMTLADKFQAIDEEMDGTLRERRYGDIEYRKSIASLANATRRAEEAAEKRARESLEQWKKVEFASLRVKEAEKSKLQVAEKTKQLEEEYTRRKEALLQREQNAIDRLNSQKESLEKDLHQQRQVLLQELEQIRMRERNLQDREQMLKDIEAIKLKELNLLKSEALSRHRHPPDQEQPTPERPRRDSVVSSCAESLRRSLTGKESRQLDEVLKELNARSDEAEILRRELALVKEEMAETKGRMQRIHQEPRTSARLPDVSQTREQDQSLRRRLDDLTRQLNDWKQQDRAERDATIQSEIGRWREEVSKLSHARELLDEKQRNLEDMTMRLNTRMNSTSAERTRTTRPSSSSLRVLMDPHNEIRREPSIRDYDPIYTGHVRWADRMPYSVHPDLLDKSPRFGSHNSSGNSNPELNDSNETTSSSSQDISTAGLRLDIQQKFRDLEKESDQLEKMYKRYMQSNYRHMSSDIPHHRSPASSPWPSPRLTTVQRSAKKVTTRPSSSRLPVTRDHTRPPATAAPAPDRGEAKLLTPVLPEYQVTHHETKPQVGDPTLIAAVENEATETSQKATPARDAHCAPLEHKDEDHDEAGEDPTNKTPLTGGHLDLRGESGPPKDERASPVGSVSEESSKSGGSTQKPESSLKPTPTSRGSTLPPLGSNSDFLLPPVTTQRQRNVDPVSMSVSELLLGPENARPQARRRQTPVITKDADSEDKVLEVLLKDKPKVGQDNSPSESSADENHPLRLSSLDPDTSQHRDDSEKQEDPKSPFERPALLGIKRDELQKSLDQSEEKESPKRDAKTPLSFHDDDGLQNILDSIDMSSARSLEGEADPKLAGLLNQLETGPVMTSQLGDKRASDNVSLEDDDEEAEEDVAPVAGITEPKKVVVSNQPDFDQDEKLLSDDSANEYSDKFLSSSASKTSSISEIKTMSDFEPSSTSIPRIEDKVAGSQRSDDEEKSGADVNWSNLQLDRSGELIPSEAAKKEEKEEELAAGQNRQDGVDVFEESQSLHSFEAASDVEKKSQSSGEDFW